MKVTSTQNNVNIFSGNISLQEHKMYIKLVLTGRAVMILWLLGNKTIQFENSSQEK